MYSRAGLLSMYEPMAERPDRFVLSAVDWQTIVDALQDGVGVLDERGHILACNQAAAAILGRSTSQLVGHTPLDLDLGAVGEDGSPLPLEAYPSAEARRSGEPVRDRVIGIHHPDGDAAVAVRERHADGRPRPGPPRSSSPSATSPTAATTRPSCTAWPRSTS